MATPIISAAMTNGYKGGVSSKTSIICRFKIKSIKDSNPWIKNIMIILNNVEIPVIIIFLSLSSFPNNQNYDYRKH